MTEQERGQSVLLTHDQIEEIASRAADKAIDRITQHVYQQVGRASSTSLFGSWRVFRALSTAGSATIYISTNEPYCHNNYVLIGGSWNEGASTQPSA